jgi:hypothetical protein
VWSVWGRSLVSPAGSTFGTAVTCPLIRIHPAIVAQPAATVTEMMPGCVGTAKSRADSRTFPLQAREESGARVASICVRGVQVCRAAAQAQAQVAAREKER